MLNERELVKGAVRDSLGERAIVLDSVAKHAKLVESHKWVLEPMYRLEAVRIAQFRTAEAEAYRQSSWPLAKVKLKRDRDYSPSHFVAIKHVIDWPLDRNVQHHFQTFAERRVAATMLALRLYEFDHQGILPDSLAELVPSYLPAVPKDPFDPSGGDIRYLPHRNPPALYSVSLNGIDDHGSERIVPDPYSSDYPPWRCEDAVFSIISTPRIAPPRSQPGK